MRLGIEQDKVRVLAGDIGGSFGLKIGVHAKTSPSPPRRVPSAGR